jgi:hypothetical protein
MSGSGRSSSTRMATYVGFVTYSKDKSIRHLQFRYATKCDTFQQRKAKSSKPSYIQSSNSEIYGLQQLPKPQQLNSHLLILRQQCFYPKNFHQIPPLQQAISFLRIQVQILLHHCVIPLQMQIHRESCRIY